MYTLPALPYAFDALEPYIDARTMEIHYTKHHQAYIDNLNKALENFPEFQDKPVIDILENLNGLPEAIRTTVRNNGGGHFNHTLFWSMMRKGGGAPKGTVKDAIIQYFSSFEQFQAQFNNAAKGVFGSGWAWLCVDRQGKLVVTSTPNQDTPASKGLSPILGLDVWEHAYYLKYQNKRPEYIIAWWHVIDWDYVEETYRNLK